MGEQATVGARSLDSDRLDALDLDAEAQLAARSGHDLVVVANRLPVAVTPLDQGPGEESVAGWARSPGGLVSGLEPALRDEDAVWVGWSGLRSDVDDWPDDPLPQEPFALHHVALTSEEVEGYYEGFCNATLWPLYHDAIATPVYHRTTWEPYVAVNRRFAQAAAAVAAPGAQVWVHDLQLQLVPAMLRELRPDVKIGFFLHVPFPPVELFAQLPWRTQVLDGLLGADLVGVHTPQDVDRLMAAVHRYGTDVGLAAADPPGVVRTGERRRQVKVAAFPISVDAREFDAIARTPQAVDKAAEIRRRLGNPRHLLLGVDRLDYTKGIDVRLKAVTELLAAGSIDPADTVFVQIATPTREHVEEYQRLRDDIAQMVGQVIGDHADIGVPPVQYLHQPVEREDLVAFYLAADVMLVTPYRDGMNLVAKEFVASRHDGDGALVLSEFAGAAVELHDAYLVNPHDAESVKRTILAAMHAPADERRRRMAAMREVVFTYDTQAWATRFLTALDAMADPRGL